MLSDTRYKGLTSKQVKVAELLKERRTIRFNDLKEVYSSRSAAIIAIDRLVLFGVAKRTDCGIWGYVEK